MYSFCLDRTTARSAISKSLILVPVLSFGVLFHTASGASWHCQQGPVPGYPYLSLCPGCANKQHSYARASRSGTLGHAMPRRLLLYCWGFLFWLQAKKPLQLPIGHVSFSSCCWAGTAHLQQGDQSPSPTQICPYPCRISSICRDNGRWGYRQDWRC